MTELTDNKACTSQSAFLDPEVVALYSSSLFEKIARLYLDVTPDMVQEAQSALRQGDAAKIQRTCHALKSSSANVGAMEYSALCRELEAAARDTDLATVAAIMPRFVASHEEISEALKIRLETPRTDNNGHSSR